MEIEIKLKVDIFRDDLDRDSMEMFMGMVQEGANAAVQAANERIYGACIVDDPEIIIHR